MPAATHTLTLRLTARQREAVRRLAEREGATEEEAVLRAVEQASDDRTPSMLELAGDAIGSFDGSADLSTNRAHMEGFGAQHRSRSDG